MKSKPFLLVIPILLLVTLFFITKQVSPVVIQTYFEGFGTWTLVAYIVAYAIAVWIPHVATIMTIVGGLLFGPVFATILVILLSTFASALPFLFARRAAKKEVKNWLKAKGHQKYIHNVNKNSFLYVLYLRLLPILPYELQNYLIGLTNISLRNFFLATFVGLLPGTLALALLGETIADTSTTNIIILITVTLVAAVIPWLIKRYGEPKKILEK